MLRLVLEKYGRSDQESMAENTQKVCAVPWRNIYCQNTRKKNNHTKVALCLFPLSKNYDWSGSIAIPLSLELIDTCACCLLTPDGSHLVLNEFKFRPWTVLKTYNDIVADYRVKIN